VPETGSERLLKAPLETVLVVEAKDEAAEKSPQVIEKPSSDVAAESRTQQQQQLVEAAARPLEVAAAAAEWTIVEQAPQLADEEVESVPAAVAAEEEHCELPAPGAVAAAAADAAQQAAEMPRVQSAASAESISTEQSVSVERCEWTTTVPARRCVLLVAVVVVVHYLLHVIASYV